MSAEPATTTTCYRHPNRPAPIGCSRCGRPICLEDAIDAPVGYLCPECARTSTRVRRVARSRDPVVTKVLLGAMALAFVVDLNIGLTADGALFGPAVKAGEWWRIATAGFLHGGLLHIGFNGYLLWLLGQMLEPAVGRSRYLALFLAGLFGGSAGALLLSWDVRTIGASGAVFGLMGVAMVGLRRRGINPWQTQIGTLVIINLVFTFLVPGISIGGHVGGLLGGAAAGVPVFALEHQSGRLRTGITWTVALALGVAAIVIGNAGPF